MTIKHPHCGRCSQCIDRRLAAIAAGYGEKEDPTGGYGIDVLRGARDKTEDKTLVEGVVRVVNEVEAMDSPEQVCVRFPETARLYSQLPGGADRVVEQVYDLVKRHANQVAGALDEAGRAAISEMRLRSLPATCMLCIAFPNGQVGRPDDGATAQPGLMVRESDMSCEADGLTCTFGKREQLLVALLARLARSRAAVAVQSLCGPGQLWDYGVPEATVRGALSRLRARLKKAKLGAVAERIIMFHLKGAAYIKYDALSSAH